MGFETLAEKINSALSTFAHAAAKPRMGALLSRTPPETCCVRCRVAASVPNCTLVFDLVPFQFKWANPPALPGRKLLI